VNAATVAHDRNGIVGQPLGIAATAAAQEHEPDPAGTPPPRSQMRSLMQALSNTCTKCTLA
jgi:hypothetical protein